MCKVTCIRVILPIFKMFNVLDFGNVSVNSAGCLSETKCTHVFIYCLCMWNTLTLGLFECCKIKWNHCACHLAISHSNCRISNGWRQNGYLLRISYRESQENHMGVCSSKIIKQSYCYISGVDYFPETAHTWVFYSARTKIICQILQL